ncbi:Hsp70 family protein [Actinophytocola xanthii]|uniref:ExoP galactose-binding-like domain-containing protein n=1 Tax=Actinophytocola xanthii TaxID=1912961 RepID=A0A1Q8CTM4_9PSEU|nr:Hsp70 family protein [Actinophytocola xanthii]OLF17644.1 hypothetical protein BU204_10530 [Actinophytocola xanthii]
MGYGVGIDLGTSFTSAAVSGPNGTRMVPLSAELVVPSVVRRAPDGTLLTGTAALETASNPAHVARGFKRRLGDPTPIVLDGAPYSVSMLMSAQLRDVLAAVTTWAGAPPASIVLTCPAIWGPYRREHFAEVPKMAGVTNYRLLTEPEAAATHYSAERRLGDGEVVAVYDLGGGTFDTTILRVRNGGMEILGTPEGIEHMGGVDFDETLLAHLDNRLDGAISELDPADPESATVLARIRTMCSEAKQDLSIEPDVRLSVPLPSGPREVLVTRLEFNDMIRSSVQLTTAALNRTIMSAGLRPDDLSAVLLAGGSSRIPLVAQLVSNTFGKPVRVTLHPKLTVALGAAAVAGAMSATPPGGARVPFTAPALGPATPPGGLVPAGAATGPVPFRRRSRRRWLVPAAIAAVVAIGTAMTMVSTSGGQGSSAAATPTSAPRAEDLAPVQVFDDAPVPPWTGFVATQQDNWVPVELDAAGTGAGAIVASSASPDGLRVAWRSVKTAQVYLQAVEGRDLKSYVDADGALVFDVTVHRPAAGATKVAIHCGYPCGAELPVTSLTADLTPGQRATITIPLSCFVSAGLDPRKVNTPFLFLTTQPFEATFDNVRWEAGAAKDEHAASCNDLR